MRLSSLGRGAGDCRVSPGPARPADPDDPRHRRFEVRVDDRSVLTRDIDFHGAPPERV